MKTPSILILILLTVLVFADAEGQSNRSVGLITRPRTVSGSQARTSAKFQGQSTQTQTPARPAETASKPETPASTTVSSKSEPNEARSSTEQRQEPNSSHRLSPTRIRIKIDQAERLMKVRPVPTAMTSPSIDRVTLAALLPESSQIHLIRLSKQTFLTKGAEFSATSSLGLPVQLRVVRANGVNTAVTIFDDQNRSLVPLVVEFPIERRGAFREMAYYTSAHPALLSADLTKAGQTYVNGMVDLAARRLKERSVFINPNIVDVAKRLCVIEHEDHDRFRTKNRIALSQQLYSLSAFTTLDT